MRIQPETATQAQNTGTLQSQQVPAVQNASEPEAHAPSQAETQPPQEESQLKEVNGEAALAKALFERGTKLPNSPHPKAAVNETTSCPGAVENPCA